MKSRVKIAASLGLSIASSASFASTTFALPALCEEASIRAAQLQDIPPQILQTLTLAETGKSVNGVLRPWPWAINRAGEGHWFSSQQEMLTYAEGLVAAGQTNFDIGCFQLNYRWHGQEFSSLEQMSDPASNAAYAAWFLRSKYMALGTWKAAVGAYHSQTEAHATAYLARFEAIFAQWGAPGHGIDQVAQVAPPDEVQNANSFPLLIAGRANHGPSLVPVMDGRLRLIGPEE